jgi:hypothetical protein
VCACAPGVSLQTKGEEKAKKLILDIRNKRHKIILCHDSTLQAENLYSVNTVNRYDYNKEQIRGNKKSIIHSTSMLRANSL